MLSLRAAPPRSVPSRWASLLSPVSVPKYWTAAAFVVCAGFAGGVIIISSNDLHRLWGLIACCTYLAAAMSVLTWRSRGIDLALLLSVCGALITPMFWNAADGQKQPEVGVIARSAGQLVHDHSPYQSVASLAGTHDPNAYNPYLPVMALFGVPRALFGSHVITDPRVWFGLAFVVIFWLALKAAGARNCVRWTVFIAASPVIAFELAVGGTDVPILALMCLGFALLWRRPRVILAGIALGLASAAKATAWPAVIVAAVLIGTRDDRKSVWTFLGATVISCAAIVGPVAMLWPSALVDNTILFPLGLADIRSAAASPLPGHVLADTGHLGHMIAIGLLVLAGVGIAVSLVVRPPRTVPSAVWRLIIGLALMFTLAPATRFGYFIYPASLLLWLEISRFGLAQAEAERLYGGAEQAPEQPEHTRALLSGSA
jgi:Glycosyltransferase family 87